MEAAKYTNKRLHERYGFGSTDIAYVEVEPYGRCEIIDLSYGGMGVNVPSSDQSDFDPAKRLDAQINVLGLEWKINLEPIYIHKGKLGCRFVHDDDQTLINLRKILEPVRIGDSAFELNKSTLKKEYQGDEWKVLHGDGPVLIHVKYDTGSHEKLTEFSMTMRPYNYSIIEYREGQIYFGGMEEFTAGLKSAVMASDPALRRNDIFMVAYLILSNIPKDGMQVALGPVKDALLELIPNYTPPPK